MVEKILIISWGVYPDQNGSGAIVHNLAKALGKDKVVVIGEQPPSNFEWDKVEYPLFHLNVNILGILKGIRYHKWLSLIPNLIKVNRIIKDTQPTKIIAVFPDEYYFCLSYILSKKHKIDIYPWMHNTYLENRTGGWKFLGKILQNKVFKSAPIVFSMSDVMKIYYENQYKDSRFSTLKHAFDIEPDDTLKTFQNVDKPIYSFAYQGAINESCRDASIRICKAIANHPKCQLVVFGKNNVNVLVSSGIAKDRIKTFPFLSKEEFDQALNACDVMILAHGFDGALSDVEYKTIFPTRTVNVLKSGRPIFAHIHSSAGIYQWLQQRDCAYLVEHQDERQIHDAIDTFLDNKNFHANLVKNALQQVHQFDKHRIAQELLMQLN